MLWMYVIVRNIFRYLKKSIWFPSRTHEVYIDSYKTNALYKYLASIIFAKIWLSTKVISNSKLIKNNIMYKRFWKYKIK